MRKPIKREFDDDLTADMLGEVYETLIDGARGSGATLSKGECALLLNHLPKRLPFRPARWKEIAWFSHRRERDSGVEVAVTETMKRFGVSRSEVYTARHRWDDYQEYLRNGGEEWIRGFD